MVSLAILFLFLLSIPTTTSFMNQRCEQKVDNNHGEIKALFKQQGRFDEENWSHIGLVVILAIMALFIGAGLIYLYNRYWPLIRLALRGRATRTTLPPTQSQPVYFNPYAHSYPYISSTYPQVSPRESVRAPPASDSNVVGP
ncbi:unnamed protein product [Didymodactylos carnosus]|uniref:Uncharacterized protein n=1 Tax=Didymodactylos carnosus TaxID=1234261 RepID=A0A8S2ELZ3_9BILA|nr:unnamed protein product [Didymodactylos carnosus]CAF4061741.1 unnamed protein product [Didymodactylos carnosus]